MAEKKKTKKKTTENKETKQVKKKTTKKKEKKKIDIIDILMIGIIVLIGIFIIFKCFELKKLTNKKPEKEANILFPVIETNINSEIKLALNEFKDGAIYTFKVTNFRHDKVNKKEMSYDIKVVNKDETDIGIYKNDDKTNLVQEGQEFTIENNKLKAEEKQTDIYMIKLLSKKNYKKDSVITITVKS